MYIILPLLALILWLINFTFALNYFGNFTIEQKGSIGDSFAIVTSLFSCLTLIGLVYTIFLQHKTIRNQEAEIRSITRLNALSVIISSADSISRFANSGSSTPEKERAKVIIQNISSLYADIITEFDITLNRNS